MTPEFETFSGELVINKSIGVLETGVTRVEMKEGMNEWMKWKWAEKPCDKFMKTQLRRSRKKYVIARTYSKTYVSFKSVPGIIKPRFNAFERKQALRVFDLIPVFLFSRCL